MIDRKLAKSQVNTAMPVPDIVAGYKPEGTQPKYHDVIKQCRFYYENDALAGTVVNRLCEISVTQLRNKRKSVQNKKPISDEILAYYNAVAVMLQPFLTQCALEYVLHGMFIPEYTTVRQMGSKASDYLGRTRYYFPENLWCRNPENIKLKKLPTGANRLVLLQIPNDDINLVMTEGKNGKEIEYSFLVENFPEYVAAIKAGKKEFPLTDVFPVYRKLTSYNTYPLPYLKNAIPALEHKAYLKQMDRSVASKVIEAIRHVKVGNDEYPADDEDIKAEQESFMLYSSLKERIFNYFTNHTISISWSFPPLETLLSEGKYTQSNLEILFAVGFPRIWINGETERSNAADNATASIGPVATLQEIRNALLKWVTWFYEKLADLNGFKQIPEAYFSPINFADIAQLIQYAKEFVLDGAISLNTIAQFYGEDYESILAQRQYEQEQEQQFQEPINPVPDSTNDPTPIPNPDAVPATENTDLTNQV